MSRSIATKARKKEPEAKPISLLHDWHNVLLPPTSPIEGIEEGKRLREKTPRRSHAGWQAPANRIDPLELLQSQDVKRVDYLLPLRYGRMMQSPFAFYRGGALIMASDLSYTPNSGSYVQLCGDCHLSNFGIFATPERNIIFDLNDFDETMPGPWEWDVKRLGASFAILADQSGFTDAIAERCVQGLARVYRERINDFAQMSTLDIWYDRIDFEQLVQKLKKPGRKESILGSIEKLKQKRSHAAAVAKLTERVDGRLMIKDQPPLIFHPDEVSRESIEQVFKNYLESLWHSRRLLVQRYHVLDLAQKVVGVGSVGNAAAIALMQGEGGDNDTIFLQIKEVNESVLSRFLGKSSFDHPGQRVVVGQRMLQASADLFLGWATGPKRTFYVRQLMDVKASVPVDELDSVSLEQYAELCGYTLARAHARAGQPAVLSGYLGKSEAFDESLVKFSLKYRQQNEKDFNALVKAVKRGKIKATAES